MAIYEYKCPEGHLYTEERPMIESARVTSCPDCGKELARVFSSTSVIFKGRGFYKTGG